MWWVSTFHGVCGYFAKEAGISTEGYAQDQKWYDETLAELLVQAIDKVEDRFDAVIVDEGQDFRDNWWLPLDALLRNDETGIFYMFYDENQRIYSRESGIPIEAEPFPLTENCRNTQKVHALLTNYSKPQYQTTCLGPEGHQPEIIPVADEKTPGALLKILQRLVQEDGVKTSEIILLTPRSKQTSQWKENQPLGDFMLTWDLDLPP